MVEDAVAADDVEVVVGGIPMLRQFIILKVSLSSNPSARALGGSLLNTFGRNIDTDNVCSATGQSKNMPTLAAPVFEYSLAFAVFIY